MCVSANVFATVTKAIHDVLATVCSTDWICWGGAGWGGEGRGGGKGMSGNGVATRSITHKRIHPSIGAGRARRGGGEGPVHADFERLPGSARPAEPHRQRVFSSGCQGCCKHHLQVSEKCVPAASWEPWWWQTLELTAHRALRCRGSECSKTVCSSGFLNSPFYVSHMHARLAALLRLACRRHRQCCADDAVCVAC